MKYRNYIHLRSGKEIIDESDTHLAKKLRFARLKETTFNLNEDILINGDAVEYITTRRTEVNGKDIS